MHLLYLGNKLSKHGFTPTGIEYLGKSLEEEGFKISYASQRLNPIIRLFDMLLSVVRNRSCDLILIDTYSSKAFYYAWLCGHLAYFFRIPFILILHGGDLPTRAGRTPALVRRLFSKANKIVTVSKYLQEAFSNLYSTICIPNAIDISKYNFKIRKEVKPLLLWVRSLHKIYNPTLAVKIIPILKEEFPDIKLAMVGPDKDGSRHEIEGLTNALGLLSQIKMTGKLSKEEWINLSKEYDIFINTTNFDNMPVSVIEAMALGLPVVSTNVGGMSYLVNHEIDGLLVPPDDPKAFSLAIIRLIKDQALASVLAKNARQKAESFDNGPVLQQWKNLIHEVLQKRS